MLCKEYYNKICIKNKLFFEPYFIWNRPKSELTSPILFEPRNLLSDKENIDSVFPCFDRGWYYNEISGQQALSVLNTYRTWPPELELVHGYRYDWLVKNRLFSRKFAVWNINKRIQSHYFHYHSKDYVMVSSVSE